MSYWHPYGQPQPACSSWGTAWASGLDPHPQQHAPSLHSCYGAVKQQHSASASYGWQGGGRRSAPRRQGTNGRRTLPSVHTTNPADYGWVLQGTDERARVEYWAWAQDPSVKIDYYPTTGTVKTMLDHPSQGRTQMFRRNLSEDGFIRVLLNPRAHTGKGYQRRHTGGYGR